MSAAIARLAARIDAATLRERIAILVAGVLVLVFLANAALLAPQRARQARLAAETAQRQAESAKLGAELRRLAGLGAEDPDAPLRAREAAARAAIGRVNARIAEEERRFTPPERMRGVLEELLERNRKLQLVDLKTLPVAPLAAPGAAGPAAMYRHGLELTVRGSYLDLHGYLQALEALPTQLYWGTAELAVSEYPAITLKITVYTVSFDRAWLIV